jgi:hypothetical protein
MYNIEQLEDILRCTYPLSVSAETQKRRLTNIESVQRLIGNAIDNEALRYQESEERLHVFTTQAGEKIYLQYPGKESVLPGDKKRRFDFRPKIMTSDGQMVRDLVFADLWGLVESLNGEHHRMLKLLSAIFFQMGRMTLHSEVEKGYPCETLDKSGNVVRCSNRTLHWFEFGMDKEAMESLNFHAGSLVVDDNVSISFEAFLCFFEILLQNEDSKYYDKKKNLSSGRISTSDSMLLLAAALFGQIRLSVLLQRFVSGFGIARCAVSEIEPATVGLVHIVNRKSELINYFENHNIGYQNNSYITVRGNRYHTILKTPSPKVAILSGASEQAKNDLSSSGWAVYDLDSLVEDSVYSSMLTLYGTLL